MAANDDSQAVLIKGRFYAQKPDGSFHPLDDRTDRARLAAMTEADIEQAALDDPDNLPMTDADWQQAVKVPHKRYIHIGLDDDVLDWFKSVTARGYQTRINSVLRRYMEAHRKAG